MYERRDTTFVTLADRQEIRVGRFVVRLDRGSKGAARLQITGCPHWKKLGENVIVLTDPSQTT